MLMGKHFINSNCKQQESEASTYIALYQQV